MQINYSYNYSYSFFTFLYCIHSENQYECDVKNRNVYL